MSRPAETPDEAGLPLPAIRMPRWEDLPAGMTPPDLPAFAGAFWLLLRKSTRKAIVTGALDHRERHPGECRTLETELSHLQTRGFRDAARAGRDLLHQALMEINPSKRPETIEALLRAYMASDEARRHAERMQPLLNELDIEAAPERKSIFSSWWSYSGPAELAERYQREIDSKAVGNTIVAIAAITTRRFPAPATNQCELLAKIEHQIRDSTDPAVMDNLDRLIHHLHDLGAAHRIAQREAGTRARRVLEAIADKYKAEIEYLGVNPAAIGRTDNASTSQITLITDYATEIERLLENYRKLRPQAESRSAEKARASSRETLAKRIEERVATLMDDLRPAGSGSAAERHEVAARATDGVERNDTQPPADGRKDGPNTLQVQLRQENKQLAERIATLERELEDERRNTAYWRELYTTRAQNGQHGAKNAERLSVAEALDRARRNFTNLVVNLNRKSDPQDRFEHGTELYQALEWLATGYRNGPAERESQRISETCYGWRIRTRPKEAHHRRNRDWHTARHHGRTHTLEKQLRYTGADDRETLQIGFTSIDNGKRILIGFVGTGCPA